MLMQTTTCAVLGADDRPLSPFKIEIHTFGHQVFKYVEGVEDVEDVEDVEVESTHMECGDEHQLGAKWTSLMIPTKLLWVACMMYRQT